jgi:hypothetical protein
MCSKFTNSFSDSFCAIHDKFSSWTWQELLFGIKHNIILIENIIAYINETISEDNKDFETILQILIVDAEEVESIVEKLALNEDKQNEEDIVSKMIFLIIYYFYTTDRNKIFDMIDDVYCVFDYPPEISHLVPYMPKEDGKSLGENLKEYIKDGENKWIVDGKI